MNKKLIGIIIIAVAVLAIIAGVIFLVLPQFGINLFGGPKEPDTSLQDDSWLDEGLDDPFADDVALPGFEDSSASSEPDISEESSTPDFDINDILPGNAGGGDSSSPNALPLPPPVTSNGGESSGASDIVSSDSYFGKLNEVVQTGISGVNLSATDILNINGSNATFKDGNHELYLTLDQNSNVLKAQYTIDVSADTYKSPEDITRVFGLLYAVRGESADKAGKADFQEFKDGWTLPPTYDALLAEYPNPVDIKIQDSTVNVAVNQSTGSPMLTISMQMPMTRMIENRNETEGAASAPETASRPSTGKWG